MDKSKGKGNLRAAGKKRLEEFRQKKQQKGNPNKNSGTALKAVADADSFPAEVSLDGDSSVTQHDDLQQMSQGLGPTLAPATMDLGVEPAQQGASNEDDSPLPEVGNLGGLLSGTEESVEADFLAGPGTTGVAGSLSNAEGVTESMAYEISPREDDIRSGKTLNGTSSSRSLTGGGSDGIVEVEQSHADMVPNGSLNASSKSSDVQEVSEQKFVPEIEELGRQLQKLAEENEQVRKELSVKTERQLEEKIKVKSLSAEMELMKDQLDVFRSEKVHLAKEFSSSQKELQSTNLHLASELVASEQRALEEENKVVLFSGELDLAKRDLAEASFKFATELESMQKQLLKESATSNKRLEALEEEKSQLADEVGRFGHELHSLGQEKGQMLNELQASQRCVQTLGEHLSSEKKTLQQTLELLGEKSQLVEEARFSKDRLEDNLSAKDLELEGLREQLQSLQAEKSKQAGEIEGFRHYLEQARLKEEQLLAELGNQHEESQEQLRSAGEDKVKLANELEAAKLFLKQLTEEKSTLVASFDTEHEQNREDLRKKGEDYLKQGIEVERLTEELKMASDVNAVTVKKMEAALEECQSVLDNMTQEKSKVLLELSSVREQLVLLTERKEQEVSSLGYELQECKDVVEVKSKENSSLATLLEKSGSKLQETAQTASELVAELDMQRSVSDGLRAENGTLQAELSELQENWQLIQQSAREREFELDRGKKYLTDLEDDHSKLAVQLKMSIDELSNVSKEKAAIEVELLAYKEQMEKLEDQKSILGKLLDSSKNDLQQLNEDILQYSSDLASERDKHKVHSSGLLAENKSLVSELQECTERLQDLKLELAKSSRDHASELKEHVERFDELKQNHNNLFNASVMCQDEISKLKEEKRLAELELARHKEQTKKLEDVNKDLIGGLDEHRVRLDAIAHEKAMLLSDHGSELDRFNEKLRAAEESNAKLTAQIQQMFSKQEDLQKEKSDLDMELEAWKEQHQTIKDDNTMLGSDLSKCQHQLQLVITEKALRDSQLGEYREQARMEREESALRIAEIQDHAELLQRAHEEKVNEIGNLQHQVQELVQCHEQAKRQFAETSQYTQGLEMTRMELESSVEALSEQLKNMSEVKETLIRDVEVYQKQLHDLEKEKGELVLSFEVASKSWQVENLQLLEDLQVSLKNQQVLSAANAKSDSELAELRLSTHDSGLHQAQLAMEVAALKELMKSGEDQRAQLVARVKFKDEQVQTLEGETNQLVADLQAERDKLMQLNEEVVRLKEDLLSSEHRIEDIELERTQMRVDYKVCLTQMEMFKEEKAKLAEELLKLSHEFQILQKGEQSQLNPEDLQKSLESFEDIPQAVEELGGMRKQMEAKDEELNQLKDEYRTLQVKFEASKEDRFDLTRELTTLRSQLQQIERVTSDVENELASGVEASKHMLEVEETNHAASPAVDNAMQEDPVWAADADGRSVLEVNTLMPESSTLQLERTVKDVPLHTLDAVPCTESEDSDGHLRSFVGKLVQEFETMAHDNMQRPGTELNSGGSTKEVAGLVSQMRMLEEISGKLEQERDDARSRELTLSLDLKAKEEHLCKAAEESLHLTSLVEHLEGQQHQVEIAFLQIAELQSQFTGLGEKVANLEVEKQSAVEALFAAQAELRLSKEMLERDNHLLTGHLEVLEGTVATLHTERDHLAGQLARLEETNNNLSAVTSQDAQDKLKLQDKVDALELVLAAQHNELENHRELASQSQLHMYSLVQKLGDAITNAFPEAGKELLTSEHNYSSADYCAALASWLHAESTNIRNQLSSAHLQLSELSSQLTQMEETMRVLQKDTDMAVEAREQIQWQVEKAAEEREVLEACMAQLKAVASAEKLDHANQIRALSQEHDECVSDKVSLQGEVSALQKRFSEREAGMLIELAVSSKLEEEVKSIVSKLLSRGPIASSEVARDIVLSDPYHGRQLDAGITVLLKRCQDSDLQIEELRQSASLLSAEYGQTLQDHKEENLKLKHMLQSMQDTLQSRELDTLIKREEEQATTDLPQVNESEGLLSQIQSLNEQLKTANAEKESLHSRLIQAEQKLVSTREKLSLAVNKGKAVVQQRDTWKLSLAEKSKEFDLLVAAHQQDLQLKDAALVKAEMTIGELTASVEQLGRSQTEVEVLQNVVATAEKVFLNGGDLVRSLCAVLDGTDMPLDWHSSDLANKALWISSSTSKLLQRLALLEEEVQTLHKNTLPFKTTAEKSDAKMAKLAADLCLLEQEKEELRSQFEDGNNNLELASRQMSEEKAQLSGIIRQLDLDLATRNQYNGDLARRLEDQAADVKMFQIEIASLQSKVSEREEEVNNGLAYSQSLEETVNSLVRNLSNLYETISKAEYDTFLSQPSLPMCRDIMKLLISNQSLMVEKLSDILGQVTGHSHASGQVLHSHVKQILEDGLSFRAVSNDFFRSIEEGFGNIEQQTISSQHLLQQVDRLSGDLSSERNENSRLQLELNQVEQKLVTMREKLSSEVSKGESLVQQRDSLKQTLLDKSAEFETSVIAHVEEVQSKELSLQEASQRLQTALNHAFELENDVVSLKGSTRDAEPSLVDRLSVMDRQLSETQLRADLAESELEIARIATTRLSSELDLSQRRVEDLAAEVTRLSKHNGDNAQQFESSITQSRLELQELVAERTELMSVINKLQAELAMQKQEGEEILLDYEQVSHKYNELKSEIVEAVTENAALHDEREVLQHRVADLEMSLKMEVIARMKLESDAQAVVARIQHITGEALEERSFDPMTSTPYNSESRLDSLCTSLVMKYETAMQEVEELSKQKSWLTQSEQRMMEKSLSEQEVLGQLQKHLASRDLELRELRKKVEEAAARRTEQRDISQGLFDEVHGLRGELSEAKSQRDILQAELVQLEQKLATTREKLGLAIKKGKGLAVQRDSMKQSLSELQLLVSSSKEELLNKESSLQKAMYDISTSEKRSKALELEVSSCRSVASTLEHQLRDKDILAQKVETVLNKCDFSGEWQSRMLLEKLEWLVAAFANAQNDLNLASQETEALKKACFQLRSDLTDAQTRAALEQESRSILTLKLEESEGELQWNQRRISDLEMHLSVAGDTSEQIELLSKRALNLEAILQQKQAEVNMAEKTVMAWVERSEESERYICSSQERISELEGKIQEFAGAQHQVELLHDRVAGLEESVMQKEAAVKAMEASRGKVANKLAMTVSKFRELCQQSEGLVVELERMHGNLQEKDAEIAKLKEEVVMVINQSQGLQEMLESKQSFLLQVEMQLDSAALLVSEPSQSVANKDDIAQPTVRIPDEGNCLANINLLQKRLEGWAVQSQSWQADLERKDVQLQALRKELEEAVAGRSHLETTLQREQVQSERLKSAVASMHASVAERGSNQIQEIEEVQAGKRLLPTSSPSPHVRGARKPVPMDVAIDMDHETSQLLTEFDDKGHGFKSLASSHFMPRGTHGIAEQIDRFCVGGGRVLMRQPVARLGLTLYWLAIHIWMVCLISAAHV